MQKQADLAPLFERFETVEWLYDGLNGKIIPWTKQHGGTSDDPSCQAFVVGRDGAVAARCPDAQAHAPGSFAKWAQEQADLYERAHPRTRMAFLPATVRVDELDGVQVASSKELDAALEAGAAVLLYVGRERFEEGDRTAKSEVAAARKFEKAVLDAKSAADAAAGVTLLRLDLAKEPDRLLAEQLGAKTAPMLVLLPAGTTEEALPTARQLLGKDTTAASLAFLLKKSAPVAR